MSDLAWYRNLITHSKDQSESVTCSQVDDSMVTLHVGMQGTRRRTFLTTERNF